MMRRFLTSALLALVSIVAVARVYVATDKPCYIAGERIWCSVFCARGPAVAYLELISSEGPVARTRIDINGGRGGGSLLIPPVTPTGNYRLYAYTGYEDISSDGPVLSVFNTSSTARVKDGVEIVTPSEYSHSSPVQTGYGFSVNTDGDRIILENTSGSRVSCCVSLTRGDSVAASGYHSIASFDPGTATEESFGETLAAKLAGADVPAVESRLLRDSLSVSAIVAVPGSGTDCYAGHYRGDGLFEFETENIFGGGDMVYLLDGLEPGQDCHLEPVSPFLSPAADDIPKLKLCRSMERDLVRRTAALAEERSSDTLAVTLPMRREHFFLSHECVAYVLDDYTRFPTMEEVFVEITQNVKLRRRDGKTRISALMNTSVLEETTRWGDVVTMVDGVPVLDQNLIDTYDPAVVKVVEVYPYRYDLGGKTFDGVVNLVTFKGNMPGVMFDDNVRIYDFHGCAWPMEHRGAETPFWHPLLTLEPGERFEITQASMEAGVGYTISVDGLTAGERAVYLRKSFVR